jgi:hypothetical protein
MRTKNIPVALIGVLIVIVLCVVAHRLAQREGQASRQASPTKAGSAGGGKEKKQRASAAQHVIPAIKQHLSEAEFHMQRMTLPEPKEIRWKAPFFDSTTCLEARHSKVALEVLPVWTRNAVLAGEMEKASGYLYSLFQLMKNEGASLRGDTALALLKLGSSDAAVIKELASVIKSSEGGLTTAGLPGETRMVSMRQNVLDHLEFYDIHSLDLEAKQALVTIASDTSQGEARAELSRFLERMGHPQPDEFWIDQLDDPDGLGFASDTLRKRASQEIIKKMRQVFEQNPTGVNGIAAASVELALKRDTWLEQQLSVHVQKVLAEGIPGPSLEPALSGLLWAKTDAGLGVTKSVLASDNVVMHDIALRALSKSQHPAALTVIRDYAEQRIQSGQFPASALQSLAVLADGRGDAALQELKAKLIGAGHTESDFALIEFVRNHRNKP